MLWWLMCLTLNRSTYPLLKYFCWMQPPRRRSCVHLYLQVDTSFSSCCFQLLKLLFQAVTGPVSRRDTKRRTLFKILVLAEICDSYHSFIYIRNNCWISIFCIHWGPWQSIWWINPMIFICSNACTDIHWCMCS